MKTDSEILWPSLPYGEWKDSLDALHMKMQVAGKIKLALNPFLNHWWHVAFYLSTSGITTGLINYKNIIFEINFDFINHILNVITSDNRVKTVSLSDCSVAEFYHELMSTLKSLGIEITINTLPVEVPNPVHCYQDTRRTYDKEYIHRCWKILLGSKMIFEQFRTPFGGKNSPVHFFWGSFDLSHTRFSGKPAEPPNYGGRMMHFAENEENFACGFWAGNMNYPMPAFYSYMYPAPKGIESVSIKPQQAFWDPKQGLFILNYDDVRGSDSPEKEILNFLESTYTESAKLAGWDIESLKAEVPSEV